MKTFLILIFNILSVLISPTNAQSKYDNHWILGFDSFQPNFGGLNINFDDDTFDFTYFDVPMEIESPVTISDELGNLQFYTNGCQIYNFEHQLMENGDSINYFEKEVFDYWCNFGGFYPSARGIVCLPFPNKKNVYVLFHLSFLTTFWKESIFMYSIIDMNENNGRGRVIRKNVPIERGAFNSSISCNRHGNGRDWWVVLNRADTSMFHTYLLDPDSLRFIRSQTFKHHFKKEQSSDITWFYSDASFSPNGKKYAKIGTDRPPTIFLYDFDRCSGLFNNQIVVNVPDTAYLWPSIEFSPNSRFLYLTNLASKLFQCDLFSDRFTPSWQLVGKYDGYKDSFGLATTFYFMATGRDKKIYMSHANGTKTLHVINTPNELGKNCKFQQNQIAFPAYKHFDLPHFPNYNLLDIAGSYCDSLGIDNPFGLDEDTTLKKPVIHFKPNPASFEIQVFINSPVSNTWIKVYNVLGQLIHEQYYIGTIDVISIPVYDWPAGGYILAVEQENFETWVGKLIVVH